MFPCAKRANVSSSFLDTSRYELQFDRPLTASDLQKISIWRGTVFAEKGGLNEKLVAKIQEKIPEWTLRSHLPNYFLYAETSVVNRFLYMFYHMNAEQREIVYHILAVLHARDVKQADVCLIDAPPGTGKSFVIFCLAICLFDSVTYLAYTNHLRDEAAKISCLHAHTVCKFIMSTLSICFDEYLRLFTLPKEAGTKQENTVFKLVERIADVACRKQNTDGHTKIVFLDEYTVENPATIIYIYWYCRRHKITLVFVGDKHQQKPIQGCAFYQKKNNHKLAKVLADGNELTLSSLMRATDPCLQEKLKQFKAYFNTQDDSDNVKLQFSGMFFVFQLFKEKFFLKEDLNSTSFLSAYHRRLSQRCLRLVESCKQQKRDYCLAPFLHTERKRAEQLARKDVNEAEQLPVELEGDQKFLPFLLIIQGFKYYHYTERGKHHLVKVVELVRDGKTGRLVELVVQLVGTDKTYKLLPVQYTFHHVDKYVDWLKLVLNRDRRHPFQFPLKPHFVDTYYSIQGKTFSNDRVEIDLNGKFLNSIYVGLSRIRNEAEQLGKIHSENLLDFIATEFFDDEFFYRLPSNALVVEETRAVCEELCKLYSEKKEDKAGETKFYRALTFSRESFETVKNVASFEVKACKSFVRIPRDAYSSKQKTAKAKQPGKSVNTQLLQVIEFLKVWEKQYNVEKVLSLSNNSETLCSAFQNYASNHSKCRL